MYTDLLKLCGYEDEELEQERPRVDKAFDILGIGKDDIARAEARVRENFDIELEGVRGLLRVWMEELVSLPLCREEYSKVVYYGLPLPGTIAMSAHRLSEDVYVGSMGEILSVGMGMIFDRLDSLLETGEKTGLGVGSAHCSLWQTHIGAIEKGIIPLPDLMISSGQMCDQPAEADQILDELYGVPTVYMDGCVDSSWGKWPEHLSERRIRYSGAQVEKVVKRLEEVTGCTFTEEIRKGGARDNAKFVLTFNTLVETVAKSDPQALSQADINLAYWMTNTAMRKREKANDALTALIGEAKERIEKGEGVVGKGAPRIYFGIRQAVDASILKMVESLGLAMSVVFFDWITPLELTRSKSSEYGERIIEGFCKRGILYSTQGGIEYLKECCKEWKVDGAILAWPYSCRPLTIFPLMAKKEIKEKLGIPVLVLEGDIYDTRNYSAGQLRSRIETFAELLKMRNVS